MTQPNPSSNTTCPNCLGTGRTWGGMRPDFDKQPPLCPTCHGTGHIEASKPCGYNCGKELHPACPIHSNAAKPETRSRTTYDIKARITKVTKGKPDGRATDDEVELDISPRSAGTDDVIEPLDLQEPWAGSGRYILPHERNMRVMHDKINEIVTYINDHNNPKEER